MNINEEWDKASRFTSDLLNGQPKVRSSEVTPSTKRTIAYSDVVRELLHQIDGGCDIIPITSAFSYDDLMQWIKSHAVGNQVFIVKDSLRNSTGQILAVVFAQDDRVLLAKDKPKVCFVYQTLNPTISDLFQDGIKVYIKPIKIVK